jgi:hypothetical protein
MKRDFFVLIASVMFAVIPRTLFAQIHFTAALDGTQEMPAVITTASGTGSFELSEDLTELRYFISYQGMTSAGVAGYIYTGKPGVNGAIIRSLTIPTSPSGTFSGVWKSTDAEPLTEAFAESLLTGRVYINLQDSKNAAGEIRGQLSLATSLHFEAACSGAQESPSVSTPGSATGVFVLNTAGTEIDYSITYCGLTGALTSGGEILTGAMGTNGPAVRTIAGARSPASATINGSWKTTDSEPLTDALVDSLIAGKLYLNFFTSAHAGGEIRGQLVLRGGIGFLASLDSSQENPPSLTGASGTGSFILNEARTQLTYNLTYVGVTDGPQSGSQIYVGSTGQNGGAVKTIAANGIASEGTFSGTWAATDMNGEFTPALAESLLTGELYVDIRATDSLNGIRGQLNLTTGIGFASQLSAQQDVPPTVVSNGTGTASVVISPDRQSISYSLTFLDLTSNISAAGGHFHVGAKGVNGGLVKTIVPPNAWGTGSVNGVWQMSDQGSEQLTPAIVNSLINGDVYINLHTGDYIGGEIRGQVSYSDDLLTSVAEKSVSPPAEFDLEQNYPNPFNPMTTIRFSVSHASFVSLKIFDVLGKAVETLVNEQKASGSYDVQFDASHLSSGVYFFRMQAGGFSAVRKMVFAK